METVKAHINKLGDLSKEQKRYIKGNLAVAGVSETDTVNAKTSSIIKKLAEKIRQRGMMTRAVEDPKVGSYDEALMRGLDPATGDKIQTVLLAKGRKVLYNPETRVAYPLPDFDNKKMQPDEV